MTNELHAYSSTAAQQSYQSSMASDLSRSYSSGMGSFRTRDDGVFGGEWGSRHSHFPGRRGAESYLPAILDRLFDLFEKLVPELLKRSSAAPAPSTPSSAAGSPAPGTSAPPPTPSSTAQGAAGSTAPAGTAASASSPAPAAPAASPAPSPASPASSAPATSQTTTTGTTAANGAPSNPTPAPAAATTPVHCCCHEEKTAKKAQSIGRPRDFLWKPVSEKDKQLVILTPSRLTGRVKTVRVLSPDGKTTLAKGRGTGVANNNREHFRFEKPGAKYPEGAIVEIVMKDGSSYHQKVTNTAKRFTR